MAIKGPTQGLFFDAAGVTMVRWKSSSQRGMPQIEVQSRAEIPAFLEEPAARSAAFVSALKEAIAKAQMMPGPVALAFPAGESLIRYFEIPLIPRAEMGSAVRFEAQKYIPFELKELYTDFYAFPDKNEKLTRVVFLAAKKETVDLFAGALAGLGFSLVAVEPEAISLMRVYALHMHTRKDEVQVVVDVYNDRAMTIMLTKNNLPLMTTAGAKLDLREEGVSEAVGKEIGVSLSYFSKNFRKLEIGRVILLAHEMKLEKGIFEGLGARLGKPLEILDAGGFFKQNNIASPASAAAAGAALRPPARPFQSPQPNLLPKTLVGAQEKTLPWEEQKPVLQKWAIGAVAAAGVLILLGHILLLQQVMAAKRTLSGLAQNSAAVAGLSPTASPSEIAQVHDDLSARAAYLSALTKNRVYWTTLLGRIALSLPDTVQLTHIEASESEQKNGMPRATLTISGKVFSLGGDELASLNRFVEALRKDKDFMKVFSAVRIGDVRKTSLESDSLTEFSLQADPATAKGDQ